jgi:hypothetical protein
MNIAIFRFCHGVDHSIDLGLIALQLEIGNGDILGLSSANFKSTVFGLRGKTGI